MNPNPQTSGDMLPAFGGGADQTVEDHRPGRERDDVRGMTKVLGVGAALMLATMLLGFLAFANLATRVQRPQPTSSDGIVVLTGGAERIKAAGQLLAARLAKRLLISGVNRVVNRDKLRAMLRVDQNLFDCCVDIDYAAQNTRGNALETRKWARQHEFSSLIVVTSSYHMPRSLTELGYALPSVELVAYPVVPATLRRAPWWLSQRNVVLLLSEYLKFLPSAAQFGIGWLAGQPHSAVRAPMAKAVAVQ